MKKEKPKRKTLEVGQELIYSDTTSQMDKVKVLSINGETIELSNRVKIFNKNGEFQRVDGKECEIIQADEAGMLRYEGYVAYHRILRKCETIRVNINRLNKMKLSEEQLKNFVKLNKKINQLCTSLNL